MPAGHESSDREGLRLRRTSECCFLMACRKSFSPTYTIPNRACRWEKLKLVEGVHETERKDARLLSTGRASFHEMYSRRF